MSPSTTDPNYVFIWTRDSSLVFKTIIDGYARTSIILLSHSLMKTVTQDLHGGKIQVFDMSAFMGPWAR